jgi:hypothetical protein
MRKMRQRQTFAIEWTWTCEDGDPATGEKIMTEWGPKTFYDPREWAVKTPLLLVLLMHRFPKMSFTISNLTPDALGHIEEPMSAGPRSFRWPETWIAKLAQRIDGWLA